MANLNNRMLGILDGYYIEDVTDVAAELKQYIAAEVIAAGEWVDLDTSKTGDDRTKYVVQGNGTALCVGVALEAAAAIGDTIRVCVYGYVEGALTDGGVSSGEALMPAAAGACDTYAAASVLPIIGVALETDSGTACDVFVFRNAR